MQTQSPPATLRSARIGTFAAFFLDGMTFATWVSRIPEVKERFHLGNAALGFALLMVSLGALLTMPVMGRLVVRSGSRLATAVSAATFGLLLLAPALSTAFVSLSIVLFLFGCAFGGLDVAMNAQAVTVERRYARPIMGSFHATFSLGGLAGALLGSLAVALAVPPLVHFAIVGVVAIIAGLALGRFLIADEPIVESHNAAGRKKPGAALVILGAITFCSMLGEGSMSDWSGIFLRDVARTGIAFAALGFAAYSLAMTSGRLVADRLTLRLGPVTLVQIGGSLAASGIVLAALLPHSIVALAGFSLVGLGLASIVPIMFSAAGRLEGVAPSVAIATVSTTGYTGFLIGPPLIGGASELISLRWALLMVAAAIAIAVLLAHRVATHAHAQPLRATEADPAPSTAALGVDGAMV